ncbi:MAG: ATPase, T2SS/T4P/T4SS family [Eubacteriales bacterium]|nr:ATPase, T2SS/T4P/T4SS family [Eubacteriales bacterium]MDY3332593.1 ATPase, T2SS/T4P/T4SS family [Gallibacter sp.]
MENLLNKESIKINKLEKEIALENSAMIENFLNNIRIEISSLGLDSEKIEEFIVNKIIRSSLFINYSMSEIRKLVSRLIYAIKSDISILEPYLLDDEISEIMVNGYKNIFLERKGVIERVEEEFFSAEELDNVVRRIAGNVHKDINEKSPIVDARLDDGSRVNGIFKNIALGGTTLTIRKFPKINLTIEDLIEKNFITKNAANFIREIIVAGENIFISGGTSSGKTTFLNAISEYIPPKERIIVVEDTAELNFKIHNNIVRLECKTGNSTGDGIVNMADLIKTSLRMRPDRLIIGEIRDGTALVNMLNGLNTGHSGMCTGHANSVRGMIRRMESLYIQEANFPIESIDAQIIEGISLIVHLKKCSDGIRRVEEISQLIVDENERIKTNIIYQLENDELLPTGNKYISK